MQPTQPPRVVWDERARRWVTLPEPPPRSALHLEPGIAQMFARKRDKR